jgi:hypothetical protein
MADVSIYVALISAAAGVGGATIAQLTTALRDSREAKRDRQERQAEATREACIKLLRAVGDLRTQVANNHSYHGVEMGARLERVREFAAAAQLHAVRVSLLVPEHLAELADLLAAAASDLAEWTAQSTNLDEGSMIRTTDFRELDDRIRAFRTRVVTDVAG